MLSNPLVRPDFTPADHGLVGWTYDPVSISTTSIVPSAGVLNVVKIKVPQPALISGIRMILGVVGATLTAGQNFAMVFDPSNSQVGVTADQSSAWASGTGDKDMPLVTPVPVTGPFVYVGFYANGSTLPTWRLSGGTIAGGNTNLATAASRFGTANTGLTTTPPATLGTITAQGLPWWVGLR